MVSHVSRPLRACAPSYFDDIFVHSRAEDGLSAVDVHRRHLRKVFEKMRENKLYANLKKCVFCASEIQVLGCYVSKSVVRADPEKISSICSWPTPKNQTGLCQWLGLANYLHKYTKHYAGLIQPMSSLLKKDVVWNWRPEHQDAFDAVKKSLASAPVLMLSDTSRPFHVVCDASDFAIGCALMQFDVEGRERVVSYQSRQMKPAEKNYPVHDKEILAMRYALIKFRVYLLGEQTFAVYTDHASLRMAMNRKVEVTVRAAPVPVLSFRLPNILAVLASSEGKTDALVENFPLARRFRRVLVGMPSPPSDLGCDNALANAIVHTGD
ncbi:hypothetical protein PF004_g14759 [Phytophthora fragariae]|uniref:Reverse transcriptase/retrotransposon-derived protein RNase H-like domain-containing protein n=2 Tax=Phytophthora fragariae TaxID=53985 RepID=A0A6G0NNA8_9STRA|nr:hypothetical protein PF004_g14759 [Phytophthora fragariae]